ncbi:ultraviolet-sensitive opsin isoform X2 [Daphnia magna]|uniref:ultraviolet-sensitive opsin isoform X2 n=1 Tax=Daphnia magna TaxID=35525 RepID=UPI001E1BD06A|nr:ultraviolet-sensitive opsin isoform X2 [Daphnia magna]
MANHAEKDGHLGPTTYTLVCNDGNATSSWNQTGFESYPPDLDGVRQFIHLACAGIGSPLNVMVANVIIRQRRLRNPRNTFWLGVIFCNLLALTNAIIEYVAFELMSAQACIIFRITAGIPYTLILVNLLLATLDRWVALTYPLFHRETVNVKLVVLVQLFFCTLVILLSTFPYWTEMIPLNECGVDTIVLEWTTVVFLSLTLLSIMAQVQIYFKARSCLRKDLTRHISNHQQNRINRLEVEATVTLACGVMSLCFFSLPFSIVCMVDWICRHHQISKIEPLQWCSFAQSALPYLRELLLVHSVYSPILYMIRSREFSEAFRSTITCP